MTLGFLSTPPVPGEGRVCEWKRPDGEIDGDGRRLQQRRRTGGGSGAEGAGVGGCRRGGGVRLVHLAAASRRGVRPGEQRQVRLLPPPAQHPHHKLWLLLHKSRYRKVGYLDIDVGQPEFTPPGFVSLHVLEHQAKDLTILYLRNPKRCFFFGDVCAKRNPKLLLTYIFDLYDYFLKVFYCSREVDNPKKSAIPLVINASGWVKGTGFHVLTEMLKYVSPTHVIRVSTTVERKNLPGGTFWKNQYDEDPPVNLVEIRAAQNSPRHLLVKKEARIIRDLRLIAYFRQCLPRDFNIFCLDDLIQGFASIHPFQLHLSKIHVIDLHCQETSNFRILKLLVYKSMDVLQVSDTDAHRFLNGTIVGMATSASPPLSIECSTPCCIGLGFIKAVDISEDCIHLITPVPHGLVEKVDIIFQSCIAVPSCLLQVSDTFRDLTDSLLKL